MCGATVFIEELPNVTLDAHGARLEYTSNGQCFVRRYPRALWRALLEREILRLDEFERNNRCDVVPIKRKRGAH